MSEAAASAPAAVETPASSTAPNDDALAPPDQADLEDDAEGKFEDEPGDEPAPAPKKEAKSDSRGPAKKPDAKPPPKAPSEKKVEAKAGDEKPPEEEYEYEWDEQDEAGKQVKRKEKLTKTKVNEILARRRRLDTEAFQRITEANKLSAPVRDLFAQLKKNPLAVYDLVKLAGGDPHASAAAYAQEWKRQQELTPEARAFEEQQAELGRQRDELDQKQAKIDKDENDKRFQEKRTRVLKSVTGALDAAKLPRHPTVLQLVGDHLAAQVRNQPEDFEPDYGLAVESAQDGLRDASTARLSSLSYEQLIEEIPDVVKVIRAGDAARVKGAPGKPGQPPPPRRPAPKQQEEHPKYLSPQEWGEKQRAREE